MKFVLQTDKRFLVSLSREELEGISNALKEVCEGVHIDDAEFQTRLGATRSFLQEAHVEICSHLLSSAGSIEAYDRADAWADAASVQIVAISVFGDPVDMSCDQAREFAALVNNAITQAD